MAIVFFGVIGQMVVSGIETKAEKIAEAKKAESLYEKKFKEMFPIKTTKGNVFKQTSINEKVVLINFWASWCFPCIEEFKSLKKFVNQYKGRVKVIAFNNDTEKPLQKIEQTEKKYSLNFESVYDENSEITSSYNLSVIPATLVFKGGKFVYYTNEQTDFMSEEFISIIDKALSKE
jgi:thiol-disulfide isomerase/thioredoxin